MPTPIWMFTIPVVVPTGGLAVGMTLSTTFGGVPKNFTSAVVPYPVIEEGKYSFFVFMAKTNTLLRQWILDCCAPAKLNITTVPALDDVLLQFFVPQTWVPTSDANKITVSMKRTGFAIGANPMVFTAATLDNTSGFWTRLGMIRETLTSMAASTVAAAVVTWAGERQPAYVFVFERQGEDVAESEELQLTTRALRDGTIRNHVLGGTKKPRTIRLFEHDSPMLGDPLPVSTFASLNVNRADVNLQTTNEVGLQNLVGNLYQNEDLLTLGSYYRVGLSRHVSRLDVKSGSPKTTSATFFEKASVASVSSFVAGQTLYRVSEYERLMRGMLDTGSVLVHEPDDFTQQTRFKGEPYALFGAGTVKPYPKRVSDFLDLWEVTLPLIRRDVPELIL